MDIRPEVLIIAAGCALVTLAPRVAPLLLLARVGLPGWALAWLKQVPVAILSALLATELLVEKGALLPLANPNAIAIAPVLIVAALTRSLIGSVLAGVVSMALLRGLFA
jgi:branched-subunit amino acid transport protein